MDEARTTPPSSDLHADNQPPRPFLYWQEPKEEFHKFEELPAELQILIWEYALVEAADVEPCLELTDAEPFFAAVDTMTVFPAATRVTKRDLKDSRLRYLRANEFSFRINYEDGAKIIRRWLSRVRELVGESGTRKIRRLVIHFEDIGPCLTLLDRDPVGIYECGPRIKDWCLVSDTVRALRDAGLEWPQLEFKSARSNAWEKAGLIDDYDAFEDWQDFRRHLFFNCMLPPMLKHFGLYDQNYIAPTVLYGSLGTSNPVGFLKTIREAVPARHDWFARIKVHLAIMTFVIEKKHATAETLREKLYILRHEIEMQRSFPEEFSIGVRDQTLKTFMKGHGKKVDMIERQILEIDTTTPESVHGIMRLLDHKSIFLHRFRDITGRKALDENHAERVNFWRKFVTGQDDPDDMEADDGDRVSEKIY